MPFGPFKRRSGSKPDAVDSVITMETHSKLVIKTDAEITGVELEEKKSPPESQTTPTADPVDERGDVGVKKDETTNITEPQDETIPIIDASPASDAGEQNEDAIVENGDRVNTEDDSKKKEGDVIANDIDKKEPQSQPDVDVSSTDQNDPIDAEGDDDTQSRSTQQLEEEKPEKQKIKPRAKCCSIL